MKTEARFQDIVLDYDEVRALDKVSCTLEEGKVYGLIGRNGAGKTSLLSLLASYREPSGGSLKVRDEAPFENAKIMKDIQFLYTYDMSEESETIEEYLKEVATFRERFDFEYAHTLLKRFGLNPKKKLNKLSTGMQSALLVVEGLASLSPITIFDEIHHGMDAPSRTTYYEAILESQRMHRRIIILSTHLVSEMAYLFDHVLILDRGKLLIDEPYDDVVERGVTITGAEKVVDDFTQGRTIIDTKTLGDTKAAMLYGSFTESDRKKAKEAGLQVSTVSLQELFIHLTKEDNHAKAEKPSGV